ncbi:hypothetical protein PTKIN_Ptkin13bG0261700 [Pterospermum kingtungense]
MADWTQLPPELLALLANCLDTRFDVLRFRSVCSSWRASVPPKLYPLPINLPPQTKGSVKFSLGDIMIDTIFLVRCPATAACRVLDSTNFQVIELDHQFVVLSPNGYRNQFIDKVSFLWSNTNTNDFMMLTPVNRQDLYMVSSIWGKTESIILQTRTSGVEFKDIISFNDKFYAIDGQGKTTVVDQSLNLSFIGSPTNRKFLVQSGDNLLDVEMISVPTDSNGGVMVVDFRIFRLNEEEQKWDEIEGLGDQILFLGVSQSISASASEFYGVKGNLIFFSGVLSNALSFGDSENVYVFDLDTYANP